MVATTLNRPGPTLAYGQRWGGVRAAARSRGRTRVRVRLGRDEVAGMIGGSRLSVAEGAGEGAVGRWRRAGPGYCAGVRRGKPGRREQGAAANFC
jgi:hypothetical protein